MKLLTMSLAAMFFLNGIPLNALAIETEKPAEITTMETGDFTISLGGKLTGYTGAGGDVIVPEGVISIEKDVFKNRTDITSVILAESVDTIEDGAFNGCSGLESINLPDKITYIGESAFRGCSKLSDLVLPKGLETISYGAFIGCSSLTDIEIPKNLKNVDKYLNSTGPFGNCENLRKVSFEEGTVKIAADIFNESEYIQEVTIPDTVSKIGNNAFYKCTRIVNIELPESVDTIEDGVFNGCSGLESINLPDKITYIGESAFRGCSKLSDLVLPKGLETISYNAFIGCSSLTEIEIPKNLKKVYKYGLNTGPFGNCENLRKVTFEEGTVKIAADIFNESEYIQVVTIPDTVLEIGNNAFYGCKKLEKVTLPESLKTIGESAFSNCSKLEWARFTGNAPENFGRNTSNSNLFLDCDSDFKIYYYKHNTGFTNPWYGYTTQAIDAIKTQPVSKTATEGNAVTLNIDVVSTDNGTLTYQWKKDGIDIKGATSKNYKIEYVKATDAGDYTVVVTNTNGIDSPVSITSKIAKITVSQKFSDIPLDHWAHEYIMNLSSEDVINGYRDGSFGAGDNITRAQAAVMIVNALDIEYKGKVPAFKDVAKDYWAAEQIAAANEAGILNGNKAGEFKPGDYITRAQIAVMISNAYKFKQAGGYKNFKDVPVGSNGHWAYEKIEILSSNGIISGYRDGNFGPGDNTTRAQFSVILSKAMDTTEK